MTDANGRELAELEQAASLLRDAITVDAPPPGLKGKVLLAVELAATEQAPAPRPPRRRFRLAFGAGALAAAAAILLLALQLGGPAGELELRAVLGSPNGAEATVEVRKTGIGRVIQLQTDELPILPKGDYYELWFVGPGDTPARPNRISAGTFHPDENGRSEVTFAAAVDPALFPVLSVTAEPGDGDPRPTGPEVLRSGPSRDRDRDAGADPLTEPGDRGGVEADAAVRGRGAHRAADVPDAVHGDLARAAGELLQDVRAGAEGERVGPADVPCRERDGLLDEVPPTRGRRGSASDDGRERSDGLALAVDGQHDAPRGRRRRASSSETASSWPS